MDQQIINLYDRFTHGGMDRREFLDRLAATRRLDRGGSGGVAAAAERLRAGGDRGRRTTRGSKPSG